MTSKTTHNAISLLELVDGATPCAALDGLTTSPSGREAALASPSASPALAEALPTSATFGPIGSISSASADLALCLESKLKQRLGTGGSTWFALTWKQKVTPAGRSVSLLRASKRRTPAPVFGSLPTPSGVSNHGKNHVMGRLDEWGGSSNPFRGTEIGKVRCLAFELWMMGFPTEWMQSMPLEMPSSRKSRRK